MADGSVYAICSGDAIKIGFTTQSPQSRLEACQTGNAQELGLAAAVDGNQDAEYRLHQILSNFRIRGEWFRSEGPVKAAVGLMKVFDTADEVMGLLRPMTGISEFANENKDLHEQVAALESREVCTQPHDDEVIAGCPYCEIERLRKQLDVRRKYQREYMRERRKK